MKVNGKTNGMIEEIRTKLNGSGVAHLEPETTDEDIYGENHIGTSIETPLRDDAFVLNDADKMEIIQEHFTKILLTLGMDLNDDSLRDTPKRVAKMFVKEVFSGLNPKNKPSMSVFENKFKYKQMVVEKNINFNSFCEHHFLPITGKAHVAYISAGTVIGLSKINRIVDYYAKRPQVQERMTVQIADELKRVLNTEDVAVIVEAKHMCVSVRGIQDESSTTVTSDFQGKFKHENTRQELSGYIHMELKN
ncbi:MAG: GTP cyclohydrolase I FolE [Bacteroidales bacterium]|nr:GTP cyclohydrolase I FolE [Bacteroidales bacterium]